jgi:hypothetical protein
MKDTTTGHEVGAYYTAMFLSRRWVLAATAAPTAVTVETAACDQESEEADRATPHADYASMAGYNKGTSLRSKDLAVAIPLLDSATLSSDSLVIYRANFNSGWSSLAGTVKLEHQGI